MVEMAASQNEAWTVSVQNYASVEPLILQHTGKFQGTLQLLKADSRQENGKGVDEACALLAVWFAAFKAQGISRVHSACLDWSTTQGAAAVRNSKDDPDSADLERAYKLAPIVALNIDPEREAVALSIGRDAKTAMEESRVAGAVGEFIKLLQTGTIENMDNVQAVAKAAAACKGEPVPVEHKKLLEGAREALITDVITRLKAHNQSQEDYIEQILAAREAMLGLEIPGCKQPPEDSTYFNELVSSVWDCRVSLYAFKAAVNRGAEDYDLVADLGLSNQFTQYLEHWAGSTIRKACEKEDMESIKIIDAKMLIKVQRCGEDVVKEFLHSWKELKADIEARCDSVMAATLQKVQEIGDFEKDEFSNLWWQTAPSISIDDLVAHGKNTLGKWTLEFLNGLSGNVTKVSE